MNIRKRSLVGIKYMLIASILFAIMTALAKILSSNISSIQIVFFRNLFGILIIAFLYINLGISQKGGKPFFFLEVLLVF